MVEIRFSIIYKVRLKIETLCENNKHNYITKDPRPPKPYEKLQRN